MAEKRWQPGEVILNETYTGGTHRLILVFPAIVVEDGPDYLALFHPLGHTYTCSYFDTDIDWAAGTRASTPIEEQIAIFMRWQPERFRLEQSRWHVLYLLPHGAGHAVWLFWDKDWRLTNWYVNLQAPYTRGEAGIQIEDYYLDLRVEPDLAWQWKDTEQFEAFVRAGAFGEEQARKIRAEGEMMAGRVERRAWPFNAGWPEWRPDASWPVPHIRDYWDRGSFPFPLVE